MADDITSYVQRARDQGWEVTKTNKGHWRFVPADKSKPIVVAAGTGSDWRGFKNFEADLKRSGLMTEEEFAAATAPTPAPANIPAPQVNLRPRGMLPKMILEQLRINPEHKMSLDLLMVVLMPKVKGLTRQTVSNAITSLRSKGIVTTLERGMYKLIPSMPTPAAAVAAEAHARAQHAAGEATGVRVVDERLKTLDQALAALAAVEKTIRETRQDLHDLAEFRRKLKEML